MIGSGILLLLTCFAVVPHDAIAQTSRKPAAETTASVALPDRALAFRVVAERLPLKNDRGQVDAEAGVLAFLRKDAGSPRPITFIIGGGPGTSSAYLNLGAIGPWRIAFDGSPSKARPLLANAETWLDFTDLVFIDPPGTGQGLLLQRDARTKERVWSVDGDINLLSDAIATWLRNHGRLAAPKLLLGQSYGGVRTPRIAEALQIRHGIALNGLILASPALDYGWRYHARTSPLSFATLLPSFAAARLESEGTFEAHKLIAVEDYASSVFIDEYLRGLRDKEAASRLTERVTAITGLPAAVVSAARGHIDEKLFSREFARMNGKLTSSYDPSVTSEDPDPATPRPDYADPFLAALKAPLTIAMSDLLKTNVPGQQRAYIVSNEAVFDEWQWNSDHGLPESVTALRKMLALDPALRVLVVHGYSDLQTPYFESTLILNQLPDFGGRIAQRNYRGGHMFYSRDESRAAFRRDAEAFVSMIRQQR
ncbi:carboxypeptidase C (cathepsin A) [Pseudorhodoplanes sinuspersici]|nr:carboxypeptidase C (cathepsin A) [Pseudorhodoplanes sinuspersici]